MKGYEELKAEKPDAMRPVFVIGSEVPIPGGATEERIRWLSLSPKHSVIPFPPISASGLRKALARA